MTSPEIQQFLDISDMVGSQMNELCYITLFKTINQDNFRIPIGKFIRTNDDNN